MVAEAVSDATEPYRDRVQDLEREVNLLAESLGNVYLILGVMSTIFSLVNSSSASPRIRIDELTEGIAHTLGRGVEAMIAAKTTSDVAETIAAPSIRYRTSLLPDSDDTEGADEASEYQDEDYTDESAISDVVNDS